MIVPAFLLPAVETLYFGLTFLDDIDWDTEKWQGAYGTSGVTSLIFERAMITTETFKELLKFPKKLERFGFTAWGLSNRIACVEPLDICRALLPHRTSLRRLHIGGYGDMRGTDEQPVGSLVTAFTALEEIEIPLSLIRDKVMEAFPRSVVKLRLHSYDELPLASCAHEVLQSLLTRKRIGVYPVLEEIWIGYWGTNETEQQFDVLEWLDERSIIIEKMVRSGREEGVRVTVDVDDFSVSD